MSRSAGLPAVTRDAFLGGLLTLCQPAKGQRTGSDAALLAAASSAAPGERVAELGSGCGPALLALAVRVPDTTCLGLEIDADLVALANRNAVDNSLADRVKFLSGEVAQPPAAFAAGSFDQVIMNPPFFDPGRSRVSPHPARALARSADQGSLADWVGAAGRLLKDGGELTIIYRAEREVELCRLLDRGFGRLRILALLPGGQRPERPAKRIILRARKAAPPGIVHAPGLILHRPDGRYTDAVERILRQAEPLQF